MSYPEPRYHAEKGEIHAVAGLVRRDANPA